MILGSVDYYESAMSFINTFIDLIEKNVFDKENPYMNLLIKYRCRLC